MPGVNGDPRHAPQYPGAQLPGHGGGRFLGEALAEAGFDLYLPLVTVGALLHDLGKTPCLGTLDEPRRVGGRHPGRVGLPPRGPGGAGARPSRSATSWTPGRCGRPRWSITPTSGCSTKRWSPWRSALPTSRCATGALPRPWPASRLRKSEPGPGGENLCALAAHSPGSAPGQWERGMVRSAHPTTNFQKALELNHGLLL